MTDDFIQFEEPARILSPCTLVCTLDPATGWCLGCGRTGDEIARWAFVTDAQRQQVLDTLAERMARLRG